MILAGDIGGTNSRLALFEDDGETLVEESVRIYPSREYASLDEIVEDFLGARSEAGIDRAAFGVAGPVLQGHAKISNLDWEVDGTQLASTLGIDEVVIANDLEAHAHGIASLEEKDFTALNEVELEREGNEALISAGTGLGEAGLHWEGVCHRPIRSEGGHVDFAPRDETEIELLRFLTREMGRVSYERVLSGPGLFNIYRFLRDTNRGDEPPWLAEELLEHDPPRVVSRHGLAGSSDLCVRALEMFVSIYGAEAGNLALKLFATGGVFVGGGIAPKILPKLEQGAFMEAFVDKGRMRSLLELVPVRVIRSDRASLVGAARLASVHDSHA